MLIIKGKSNLSNQTRFLKEGTKMFNGGEITKQAIENIANLPKGYAVGTKAQGGSTWIYEVIEI